MFVGIIGRTTAPSGGGIGCDGRRSHCNGRCCARPRGEAGRDDRQRGRGGRGDGGSRLDIIKEAEDETWAYSRSRGRTSIAPSTSSGQESYHHSWRAPKKQSEVKNRIIIPFSLLGILGIGYVRYNSGSRLSHSWRVTEKESEVRNRIIILGGLHFLF